MLNPCTWEGEEACMSNDFGQGGTTNYITDPYPAPPVGPTVGAKKPYIPFNNPYPYYNSADEANWLNPFPNPPRKGVLPEQFPRDTWTYLRPHAKSVAWTYKDVTGKFPSYTWDTRERYYKAPWSRRQPPYYMMSYPDAPARQSFYDGDLSDMESAPVKSIHPYKFVEPGQSRTPPETRQSSNMYESGNNPESMCNGMPNYVDTLQSFTANM